MLVDASLIDANSPRHSPLERSQALAKPIGSPWASSAALDLRPGCALSKTLIGTMKRFHGARWPSLRRT